MVGMRRVVGIAVLIALASQGCSPESELQSLTVTPETASIAVGTTQAFVAEASYSGGPSEDVTERVTWTSSRPEVATISERGVATAVGVGATILSAQLESPEGEMKEATVELKVTEAVPVSLAIAPNRATISVGLNEKLVAFATLSDGTTQDVTAQAEWSTSPASVALISNEQGSRGRTTGVSEGSALVTARLELANSVALEATAEVTVTPASLRAIKVTPDNPTLARGATLTLAATGEYTDGSSADLSAQVTWTSTAEGVATVSNASGFEGTVTAVAEGSATITATLAGIDGSVSLGVGPAVATSIAVAPLTPSIPAGTAQQFTATATLSDGTTRDVTEQATWSSSDERAVTISNSAGMKGQSTGVAQGTSTITAVLDAFSSATTITVTAPILTAIAISPSSPSVAAGRTQQLVATGTYSDGTTQDLTTQVVWGSLNDQVARVSNDAGSKGLATGVAQGTTTLSATQGTLSGSVSITVTAPILEAIVVTPVDPTISVGGNLQLTARGTYSDGSTQDVTTQVFWTSSDDAVATVSNASGSEGLAIGLSPGPALISAGLDGVFGQTSLTVQ